MSIDKMPVDKMLDGIQRQGYAVLDNALPQALVAQLLADCQACQANFAAAGVGRGQDFQHNRRIRKDKTLWLEGHNQPQQTFLTLMNEVRKQVNRAFFLGLFDYECHYARYDSGDFYHKHLDAFKGRSNRVLSTVCYLNTPQQGGALLLYGDHETAEADFVVAKVAATAGTLVVFESERFPHEVLPALDVRYSIAGWFR